MEPPEVVVDETDGTVFDGEGMSVAILSVTSRPLCAVMIEVSRHAIKITAIFTRCSEKPNRGLPKGLETLVRYMYL
jgi:hypothetical protein